MSRETDGHPKNSRSNKDSSLTLPPGWSKGFSRSQNKSYYCHLESKHTQWHFPTASEVADPFKAIERAKHNRDKEARQQQQQQQQQQRSQKRSHLDNEEEEEEEGLGDILSSVPPIINNRHRTNHSVGNHNNNTTSSLSSSQASSSRHSNIKRPRPNHSNSNSKNNNSNYHHSNNKNSHSIDVSDLTCPAIIVPYRDLHPAQNRAKHLAQFLPHMHRFMDEQLIKGTICDYHIYIMEQSDDGRKFNRGKLLNIGFDVARKSKVARNSTTSASASKKQHPHDVFIFHDVDLLPGNDLASSYTKFPTRPLHIARVWDRYSNNPKYFGGIVSFSSSDMKRINGYPNTFWGWGGEDDEMQKRCERLGIQWDSPSHGGTITDLEQMSLSEKLSFLRNNKSWKCMVKWEALNEHESTWRTNGLANLTYDILKVTHLPPSSIPTPTTTTTSTSTSNSTTTTTSTTKQQPTVHTIQKSRASIVHTDIKLNNGHWADKKCGLDYMGH